LDPVVKCGLDVDEALKDGWDVEGGGLRVEFALVVLEEEHCGGRSVGWRCRDGRNLGNGFEEEEDDDCDEESGKDGVSDATGQPSGAQGSRWARPVTLTGELLDVGVRTNSPQLFVGFVCPAVDSVAVLEEEVVSVVFLSLLLMPLKDWLDSSNRVVVNISSWIAVCVVAKASAISDRTWAILPLVFSELVAFVLDAIGLPTRLLGMSGFVDVGGEPEVE
jgi:hypothetical protein